jgi:hypothetical protein
VLGYLVSLIFDPISLSYQLALERHKVAKVTNFGDVVKFRVEERNGGPIDLNRPSKERVVFILKKSFLPILLCKGDV